MRRTRYLHTGVTGSLRCSTTPSDPTFHSRSHRISSRWTRSYSSPILEVYSGSHHVQYVCKQHRLLPEHRYQQFRSRQSRWQSRNAIQVGLAFCYC